MTKSLFLQSEVRDPYKLYETMVRENPVYWDQAHSIWALYSYEACTAILNNPAAHIPAINPINTHGLNEYALKMTGQFARLANGLQHEIARQASTLLFDNMNTIAIHDIMQKLLENYIDKNNLDWVDTVCKKLPLMAVLKSFDFNIDDCGFISGRIEQLVKIMQPDKTSEQVAGINKISREVYTLTMEHLGERPYFNSMLNALSEKHKTEREEAASLFISNLIGFFIQSYDAGRGLLSNSLLQVIKHGDLFRESLTKKEYLQKIVIETLRFDPPVHNTRRIAVDDIAINNMQIKKGQAMFIVLAAANRDPYKFDNPGMFDIERTNNNDHLTFGAGGHRCPANRLSVKWTIEGLACLFAKYKRIQLLDEEIQYEAMINVRLPKAILISLV